MTHPARNRVLWRNCRFRVTVPFGVRESCADDNEFLSMVSQDCRWIRTRDTNYYYYTPPHRRLSSEQTTPRHHVTSCEEKGYTHTRRRTGKMPYSIDACFCVHALKISEVNVLFSKGNCNLSVRGSDIICNFDVWKNPSVFPYQHHGKWMNEYYI